MNSEKLKLTDRLAIERTRLANERTFLAFFRSAVFFLGTGISIIQINFFEDIPYLGWSFIMLSPFMFLFGLYRLISVRKFIKKTIEES